VEIKRLVDEQGQVVCERCEIAKSFWTRTRGLLGRKGLAEGEGLFITRTSSIHTFFMAFPIDVVFLDRKLRVRSIAHAVKPNRISIRWGGGNVIELAAGEATRVGIRNNSQIAFYDET
jgi:uncharacterized protein